VAIFVHGGAFCAHTPTEYLFAGGLLPLLDEKGIACRVLCLDYSLCPESSVKQALHQLLYSWTKIVSQTYSSSSMSIHQEHVYATANELAGSGQGCKVVLCGDSAGGFFVKEMMSRIVFPMHEEEEEDEEGGDIVVCNTPPPAALVCISPWLNLERFVPPFDSENKDETYPFDILTPKFLGSCLGKISLAQRQLGWPITDTSSMSTTLTPPPPPPPYSGLPSSPPSQSNSPRNHMKNKYGNKWPRTMVVAGGLELLRKDSINFALDLGVSQNAKNNRISVKMNQIKPVIHNFSHHLFLEDLNGCHDWCLVEMLESKRGMATKGMQIMSDFIIDAAKLKKRLKGEFIEDEPPSYILLK
jgi:acetyl esterase/lipase